MTVVSGPLYSLNELGLYRADNCNSIDTVFCGGTLNDLQPNNHMDQLTFQVESAGKSDSCTVQDWLESMENGNSPDRLTILDRTVDSSIGALGNRLEYILHTTPAVPLFEFRNLPAVNTGDMPRRVSDAE